MIISDEEVREALAYLQTSKEYCHRATCRDVSPELMNRVHTVLRELPETRDDRVAQAIERLHNNPPSADEVADKIISRTITDSLR
ncbi:MAG: hypothetical protein RBS78_05720 [Coriobacteriia bacterium]|jgi:hypothetical protein|nr:hypothetical protein [Coriobacteriia bacterium]